MFRVSFLVEDKKLAGILRAAAGNTYDLNVAPVDNLVSETPVNGRFHAKHPSGRGDINDIIQALPVSGAVITPKDLKPILESVGWQPNHRTYVVNKLVEMKVLKKRSAGKYVVQATKRGESVNE